MSDIAAYRRAYERERAAREDAEALLESRSLELYRANKALQRRAQVIAQEVERRDASLYHDSPTPLFEANHKAALPVVDAMRAEGRFDVARWFEEHPDEHAACITGTALTSANRAALDLLGATDIDDLRAHAHKFFRQEYFDTFACFIEAILRDEPRFETESRFYARDDRPIDVSIYAHAFGDGDRRLENVVCSIFDITDRKRAERELEQAKSVAERAYEAKSQFVAGATHEIRTPLNAVIGLAQVLERCDLPDGQREHASMIRSSGEELVRLLGDMLDLARMEAGHLDIAPDDVDVGEFAREIDHLWRPSVELRGLELFVNFSGADARWARFDPLRIRQVANNLISNALKFTSSGAITVDIALNQGDDDGRITVLVKDTGVGIEESVLPRLWERFAQADESTWRQYGGSGLGLAIVQRIVTALGGKVGVTSTPGVGSSFTAEMPCGLVERDRAEHAESEDAPKRILAVEDNPLNQRVLNAMLNVLGIEADFVGDGEEALIAVAQRPYDLILMDICLPIMDGEEATRRIRAMNGPVSQTPIVAVTADAMPGRRKELLAAGLDDMLPKPVDGVALARAIERWTSVDQRRRSA